MGKGELYCEIGFLNKFWATAPDHYSCEKEDIKRSMAWINFRNYIFKSIVHLNISLGESKNFADNKILFQLLKRYNDGEDIVRFDEPEIIQDDDINQNYKSDNIYRRATFLIDKPADAYKKITNAYGLLAFDNESIYKSQKYFEQYPKSIVKGELHSSFWKFLNEFKHPCNSLTIIDNYLLQNDHDIEKNIVPIIKYLAPEKLKIPFHISIFALDSPNNKIVDFKRRYESIKQKLKEIRPNLEIKLGVFLKNKDEHDRYIITNYISIDSGAGFDLNAENDKTKHGTAIKINFPETSLFISEKGDDLYLKVKKIEKKIFENAVSNNNLTNFWGEKTNRLFDN